MYLGGKRKVTESGYGRDFLNENVGVEKYASSWITTQFPWAVTKHHSNYNRIV